MKWLWLIDRLAEKRLKEETTEYLDRLAQGPVLASRKSTTDLLARLRDEPGPKVCLGQTTWDEPVEVPLAELVNACGLTIGGMGTGKSMFAALVIDAMIRQLPHLHGMAFGVLDAKGELFDRALYLLGQRLNELTGKDREALERQIVIIDFSARQAISPYNILVRWPYTEPDYFIMSRMETLRELLPAGEKLSLRGAAVLRYMLMLLSEFGLPVTYLDRVLSSETFRARLLARSSQDEVKAYFRSHYLKEPKPTLAALRARMDSLFASEGVRLSLAGSSAPDFRQVQNEGKIVLVNCAGPTITRGVRLLLQGLILSDIRQAIFARPNQPPISYLWCADEAQNFFLTRQQQENIADILSMGRSFGSFFYFLCQNVSTAVPDARILEILHTNIRWSMTFRSTPRDALFLRPALPITGCRERPRVDPFREPSVYSPEEERALALDSIAYLPDRTGYLWLKPRSGEAIKLETRALPLAKGEQFNRIIEGLRRDPGIGGRHSRPEYERLIEERDREWLENPAGSLDLERRMEQTYHQLEDQE